MSIMDLAIVRYGTVEGLFLTARFLRLPFDQDTEAPASALPAVKFATPQAIAETPAAVVVAQTSKPLQTMIDMAIQVGGGVEAVFQASRVSGRRVTDALDPGSEIAFTRVDERVRKVYTEGRHTPAFDFVLLEGIDYWGIEVDFIVQGEFLAEADNND